MMNVSKDSDESIYKRAAQIASEIVKENMRQFLKAARYLKFPIVSRRCLKCMAIDFIVSQPHRLKNISAARSRGQRASS